MNKIYKNIEEYNPNKKRKILIVFKDMIADMFSNKKLKPTATEFSIRGRKLSIFFCFYYTILFSCTKICQTKFYALFYYKNFKQTRTSANLTGDEILPSNQRQIIEQAKFTYSSLRKPLEKQRKTIEDQGRKQIDAIAN